MIVHWRPYGSSPTEPTWRRRGLNVIQGLQKLGVDIKAEGNITKPCDVFVFQRTGKAEEAKALKGRGTVTVFDINDCQLYEPFHSPTERDLCLTVDYIVAASRYMVQRYAELNPNVVCIQEAIEDTFFEAHPPPPAPPPFIISWHGMDDNLQYFEPIVPALERLAKRVPILVKVVMPLVGSKADSNAHRVAAWPFPTQFVKWRLDTFIREIASAHIGVAPLHNTEFCRNKGYHKAVGYQALSIPCVAADISPYRDVIDHGKTGILARTTEEWYTGLLSLVKSESLRQRLAAKGRATADRFRIAYVCNLWREFLGIIKPEGAL